MGIELEEKWNILLELGVRQQTIEIVTCINGYNHMVLDDMLYVHTGYRNFEQLEEEF